MRRAILLGILVGCFPSWASRTMDVLPMTVRATNLGEIQGITLFGYASPGGSGAYATFTFKNISPAPQTVRIDNANEKTVVDLLFGGGVSFRQFSSAPYNRPQVTLALGAAGSPTETVSVDLWLACHWQNGTLPCHYSSAQVGNAFWSSNGCPAAGANAGQTHCWQQTTYTFSTKITVDQDRGAVMGSVFATTYINGGINGAMDRVNFPINGGRPF